jgi:hypothetical protein
MKRVRIDGGGEFANDEWRDWAKRHGIVLEVIPAYSSAANGVVERKHRTTFARVRAILHDSGLPKSLWSYAVAYVTYTDNLLPSAHANFQIPAELWTGKRQDISHLRPFGARGWATIVNGTPGALDNMSVEGQMVGYLERGTYLLYTASGSIIKSRDVTWEEGKANRTRSPVGGEDIGDIEPTNAGTDEVNYAIDRISDDAPRNSIPDQTQGSASEDPSEDPPQSADPPQNSPRRSNRTRTTTEAKRQSDETAEREMRARAAGEEWATDSRR